MDEVEDLTAVETPEEITSTGLFVLPALFGGFE
jgi:hypothetical protein